MLCWQWEWLDALVAPSNSDVCKSELESQDCFCALSPSLSAALQYVRVLRVPLAIPHPSRGNGNLWMHPSHFNAFVKIPGAVLGVFLIETQSSRGGTLSTEVQLSPCLHG